MRHITLKSVAVGWLLSTASLAIDCGNASQPRGTAGAGGIEAGLGGQAGRENQPESAPNAGSGGAGKAGGDVDAGGDAGEAPDASLGGAAGAVPDARQDDARSDAAPDSSGGAAGDTGAGSGGSPSLGGTGGSPSVGGAGGSPPTGGAGGSPSSGGASDSGTAGTPSADCGAEASTPTAGDGGPATRAQVQAILDTRCVFCHHTVGAPEDLDLSNVALVVGVPSEECPDKLRIQAGSAAHSYLVDKLLRLSQTPCGCLVGQQMPLDDTPLDADDMATIRDCGGGAQ